MEVLSEPSIGIAVSNRLLDRSATSRDAEARVAAALKLADDSEYPASRRTRTRTQRTTLAPGGDGAHRRLAAEIVRRVEARLPGRIRDLQVRIDNGEFILIGSSTSYYVKQIAQHEAMGAMDEVMLARLVNAIEVRSAR